MEIGVIDEQLLLFKETTLSFGGMFNGKLSSTHHQQSLISGWVSTRRASCIRMSLAVHETTQAMNWIHQKLQSQHMALQAETIFKIVALSK